MNKQQSSHHHSNALTLTRRTASAYAPHAATRATVPYSIYVPYHEDRALIITTAIATNTLASY